METGKLVSLFRLIRFEHSVFALPFALISMMLAADGFPTLRQLVLIILACVCARSAAMAFNRIADLKFDMKNPRTKNRELPTKTLSLPFAGLFVATNCVLFILVASLLNRLALYLSPVALLVLLGYSYTKRFTVFTHVVLGLALGIAPVGAWIAVRGDIALTPVVLGAAVLFWTAGFDIIYSCRDYEFDKSQRLCSIPKRFGLKTALLISSLTHLVSFALFILTCLTTERLGVWYLAGLGLVAVLLIYEHSIVSADDLSRVNTAFFTVNGIVSILLFCFAFIDIVLAR